MFYSLNEPFNYVQQAVSSTSSAALHDSGAKATQTAELNKIHKKHVFAFFRDCASTAVTFLLSVYHWKARLERPS